MANSLRGHFLVAGCRLRDPNFFKSVVLIVEHGPEGAMGLVVNAPDTVTVAQSLKGHFELPENGAHVFVGGPVERAALFIVHNCADLDVSDSSVVADVYMGGSSDVFESVIRAGIEQQEGLRYRVYCGCSGWGPGQLEGELERGDWIVLPASAAMIFHDDPYSVWDELIAASRASQGFVEDNCDHPEWN
jgi:putative transcriptional regulator